MPGSGLVRGACVGKRVLYFFARKDMRMIKFPSPAVSIVGRHNSGKTTLIEKLIAELVGLAEVAHVDAAAPGDRALIGLQALGHDVQQR